MPTQNHGNTPSPRKKRKKKKKWANHELDITEQDTTQEDKKKYTIAECEFL